MLLNSFGSLKYRLQLHYSLQFETTYTWMQSVSCSIPSLPLIVLALLFTFGMARNVVPEEK